MDTFFEIDNSNTDSDSNSELLNYYNRPEIKKDKEFWLEVVKPDPFAFRYADASLKKDREFMLELIKKNDSVLELADDSLKKDKNFILEAYYANPKIINNMRLINEFQNSFDYIKKKLNNNRKKIRNNNKNLKSFIISGKENNNGRRLMGSTLRGIKAPINASTLRLLKNFIGKKKTGGSQFVHIPNYGKRKVRYQKNGRAYVIVKGKKVKL